jgi:7-keto-8-aminopelargonate synthetase-like enzyme
LTQGLLDLGFQVIERASPIMPILCGEAETAVRLSTLLLENNVWCPAIRPPTVPIGSSRLRATANAARSDEDVARVLCAFAQVKAGLLQI